MPELESVLDELRALGDRPPAPPSPLEPLVVRARRRRRRRRVGAGLLSAAAVAGALLVVDVARDDGGSRVEVVSPPPPPDARTSEVQELQAEPSTELRDGQLVRLTGPFDAEGVTGVGQCGDEARGEVDPLPWCEILPWTALPGGGLEVRVARSLDTANGVVDCTQRPSRCVLGVRVGSTDHLTPIAFDPDLPPLAPPTIELDRVTVQDGEPITITGSGFAGGAQVSLGQCRRTANAAPGAGEGCDEARTSLVFADAGGRLRTTYLGYSDIRLGDRWETCQPCVLTIKAPRQPAVELDIRVRQPAAPRHADVRITTPPPYAPGQRVTLMGSGFQAGQGGITFGICGFRTDQPELEVQGDPRYGHTPCGYPYEGMDLVADARGGFVVPDYPLPSEPFGFGLSIDCAAPDARCGLALHPMEGSLPIFVTLFDLG